MNILFITHYSGFYGANRSLLNLMIELQDNFFVQPTVIVPRKGEFIDELERAKINYLEYKYYNWLNPETNYFKNLIKRNLNILLFHRIKRDLINKKRQKFDIIHTNSSVTNLGGYLSKKLNLPHVWHIREYGYLDYNLVYYCGIINATKYMLENSTSIIVISNDLKCYYSKYINSDKLNLIYNGIKINQEIIKKRNTLELNLCIIGAICEGKNQLEVIKACEYLIFTLGYNKLVLNIVGNGDALYENYLREYVLKNSLENNIKFVGYIKDVPNFLQNMDIGIVASKREAFGRVTIEYLLNKIPVIASNTGANPELVKNGLNGFLYKFGEYRDLAFQIQKLYDDRNLIVSMGEWGYNDSKIKYSSAENTKRIFSVYRKLLA